MIELKYISNVKCPFCGHINETEIPKDIGLIWIKCQGCNQVIWGKDNPHGGNGVFCTYGDVPGLKIQEQEPDKY